MSFLLSILYSLVLFLLVRLGGKAIKKLNTPVKLTLWSLGISLLIVLIYGGVQMVGYTMMNFIIFAVVLYINESKRVRKGI